VVKLVVNPTSTCPDSISRLVKIYPVFRPRFDDSGIFCPGSPITFKDLTESTIKPITQWNWSFGDGTRSSEQSPVHTFATGGTYNVVLATQNIKECADTTVRRVIVQNFTPYAGDDTIIVKGEYIQFDAKGGTSYTWSPPDQLSSTVISNPIGTYPDTGTWVYRLYVTSDYGCTGYDTIKVWVVDNASFVVPTAFTPNGDGRNDYFRPRAVGYRSLKYFKVFNRWGQEVYFGKSLETGWNGTFNNKPAEMGVYFWQIQYTDRHGGEGFLKGDVTLLR
jgi:gliding motility-associated-like protein